MSERFQVPEPSTEATQAAWKERERGVRDAGLSVLRAAYLIDLPAIVRSEVERALRSVGVPEEDAPAHSTTQWVSVRGYLAARFGEGGVASTEGGICICPAGFALHYKTCPAAPSNRPAPSATAETLTLRPQGHVIPGVPVPFTESERAFLRLFVRDYLAQVDLPAGLVRGADTVAAARALLAEGEP